MLQLGYRGRSNSCVRRSYEALGIKVDENPTKTLCGPDQKPLETLGELYINLLHKETNVSQSVFKIRVLKRNLLGLHAIKALNGTVNWYQSLNIT